MELELRALIEQHELDGNEFQCEGKSYPKTMKAAMSHWRKCAKHKHNIPCTQTVAASGTIKATAAEVNACIDDLVGILSTHDWNKDAVRSLEVTLVFFSQ